MIAAGLVVAVHNVPHAGSPENAALTAALMGLSAGDPNALATPQTLDGQIELVDAVQPALGVAPLDRACRSNSRANSCNWSKRERA